MADEDLWRRRFRLFLAVRLFGVAIFLLGIFIGFTDLLFEGGWPLLGVGIALMGLIDATFSPRLLKRLWEQQDR